VSAAVLAEQVRPAAHEYHRDEPARGPAPRWELRQLVNLLGVLIREGGPCPCDDCTRQRTRRAERRPAGDRARPDARQADTTN